MAEPKNNFVEILKVWEHHLSVQPVAIILYDSNGGNVTEFHFARANFQNLSNCLLQRIVAIEVQLGRQIWGSRDHFKIVTSDAEIVEIQRKDKTGKDSIVASPN